MAEKKKWSRENTAWEPGCIPSEKPENDWTYEHAAEAKVVKKKVDIEKEMQVPRKWDLREGRADWWNVIYQDDSAACVGIAVSNLLKFHFVEANRIEKDEGISARYIWMAAKEMDSRIARPTTFIELLGTDIKAALNIARKYGVVKERTLPFQGALYGGDWKTFYAEASRLKVDSYYNLYAGADSWEPDTWCYWLCQRGPIVAAIIVDENFYYANKSRHHFKKYYPMPFMMGHAVLITGYDFSQGKDKGTFTLMNSWRVNGRNEKPWGDEGFATVSLDYIREACQEAYGVFVWCVAEDRDRDIKLQKESFEQLVDHHEDKQMERQSE